jgi:hypothetical protein
MRERLPEKQFNQLAHKKTKPKVVSIVEMIREIQQFQKNK